MTSLDNSENLSSNKQNILNLREIHRPEEGTRSHYRWL
uniref:Uncharacterized protein n=1 Tax=Trichinella nativa TaxID=6335 RepID=A0A0V1KHK3_9BILA